MLNEGIKLLYQSGALNVIRNSVNGREISEIGDSSLRPISGRFVQFLDAIILGTKI